MAIIVPNVGEEKLARRMVGLDTNGNLTLKLYVNDVTPGDSDTAGTYTEMSTQGYAAKTLTAGSWTVLATSAALALYAEQTWTFDGTGGSTTVYGYFVVEAGGVLLWAERFGAPITIVDNGDDIAVTPLLTVARTA
jgi:hypothetical protein